MIKHKIISKYGITKYYIKSRKGQQLEENAVQILRNRMVPGLLSVEVNRKKSSFQLVYDVTGLTVFNNFLQQAMTKKLFIGIVRGIIDMFNKLRSQHMEESKILFEMNSIYVNPTTYALFYIYVPICDFNNGTNIRDFLLSLPSYCVFPGTEDNEYVGRYLQFLNEKTNLSLVGLSELLDTLEGKVGNSNNQQQAKIGDNCPYCGEKIELKSVFCQYCGKKLSTVNNGQNNTYDPLQTNQQNPSSRGNTSSDSLIHNWNQKEELGGNKTTVLGNGFTGNSNVNGTTVLGQNMRSFPYLIRKYTEEKILIDNSPFRIGKERQNCNYYVPDNSAVSRNHADIFSEEGKYYIVDNGSTNYTYLDGRRIEQHVRYEIENNMQIRLANEDFTFYVTEEA